MPKRQAVLMLPGEVREELDSRLLKGGFSGYVALAEWLETKGYEISKSAVHRYGQQLERKMAAIKASTQAAKAIAEAAPDDEDSRSAAVISLVQTGLFDAMVTLQEASEAPPAEQLRLLSRAAIAIADVSRASISNKKWAAEIKGKVQGKFEALEKEAATGKGLDAETLRRVREEIYGVL
jgi:hypothetical protein